MSPLEIIKSRDTAFIAEIIRAQIVSTIMTNSLTNNMTISSLRLISVDLESIEQYLSISNGEILRIAHSLTDAISIVSYIASISDRVDTILYTKYHESPILKEIVDNQVNCAYSIMSMPKMYIFSHPLGFETALGTIRDYTNLPICTIFNRINDINRLSKNPTDREYIYPHSLARAILQLSDILL